MRKVDLPEGELGDWVIKHETVSREAAAVSATRAIVGGLRGRHVPPGTYTVLYRSGFLVMSDTPDEQRDHKEFVNRAKGRVLIAGLGLGMVVQAVLDKPEVEHVTVVEVSKDLIGLVGPHYLSRHGDRLEIIHGDIFSWQPPKGARYDAAWFDIWDNICTDNLVGMTMLKRRFSRRCNWIGCWSQSLCRELHRQDSSHPWYLW